MLSLEQTKNGCGQDQIVEAEGAEISSLSGADRNQKRVGRRWHRCHVELSGNPPLFPKLTHTIGGMGRRH